MMTSINSIHLEVRDPTLVEAFYRDAFGLGDPVHLRASDSQSTGFRGFTLSLVVPQPATVDALVRTALDAGATSLKPARMQLWGGYSGVVQAPDATIWKIAAESKKDTGPATRQIDGIVLLLGVADLQESRRFYVDRGLTVAKRYGSYTEFEAPSGAVKLGLYKRRALAKDANVSPDGGGSHRIVIGSDAASFTDPDGFVWETAA
jgi:predicted lactoylglutathione lyase